MNPGKDKRRRLMAMSSKFVSKISFSCGLFENIIYQLYGKVFKCSPYDLNSRNIDWQQPDKRGWVENKVAKIPGPGSFSLPTSTVNSDTEQVT